MILEPSRQVELAQGKQALLRAFRADPNCTAFGYGFRRRDGRLTDEPVVVASVAKKRPRGYVARSRLLPRTVDVGGYRYGVDVVQAGRFSLGPPARPVTWSADGAANLIDPIPEKMRPARQGCVIANARTGHAATFGCVVRDLANGGVPAILSSAHALGALQGARSGDPVAQPQSGNAADVIGKLQRFTTARKDRPNRVDAAVVSLDEPEGEGVDTLVARGLMPPIQVSHPVIGLAVANASDASTLVVRMAAVLDEMDVDFFGAERSLVCDAIDFNVNVDKVGAASGYTSSWVVAMGVTPVNLAPSWDAPDYYVFDDLVQIDSGFTLYGDSGAAICRGGNGNVRIPLGSAGCEALENVERATELPVTGDNSLADRFRDDFLADSKVGRMLSRIFYVNYPAVVDRTAALQLTAEEKDWVSGLYDIYRDRIANGLADPQSTDTIQDGDITNVNYTLFGLIQSGRLTDPEVEAAIDLYTVFERTNGMNRTQLVAMMNDDAVYREVYDIVSTVPTVEHLGAFGADA